MSALYSNRLEKRNFELDFNHKLNYEDYPEIGEITGDQFIHNDIDKGMPVRGNFTPNKNDKKNTFDNNNVDFDLFDKKSNFKINYYDPFNTSENFNNIANLDNFRDSNKIITNDIDKMSNTIDNYGYFLFDTVQKYSLKNHYLISSFYLNTILSSLFIASKNKTLLELKNYLGLTEKQKCMADINMFYSELEKLDYFNINNFLIVPYDFKINKNFISYLNSLIVVNYETKYTNLNNECIKINKYISNSLNFDFSNTLKSHHLKENSVLALVAGKIEPIWLNNFDEVIQDTFYSFTKRNQNYLLARNKNFYYGKYDKLELIELRSFDNKISFGIITTDDEYFPQISSENINLMIENLTLTKFKYLLIPQIKENLKMRYTNILKESGLQRIFQFLEIPDLFSNNNICLNDIVQNIYLVIDKNKQTSKNNTQINVTSSNAKRINTPFIYYLRLNTMNTILCIGQYC